ncbi:MAG TPA: MATE family efflux transporter, partial [Polyangiaceae bacterium]|nr:MATE family efflux transporter [Polyangiaceae bacterium]
MTTAQKDFAKTSLFALTWPIFIEQGLRILVGTVDVLMVSRVSDDAVAALGQAGQVVYLSIVVFSFISLGASVVITHHLGAKDRVGADRVASAAVTANTWIGLVVSLLVFFFSQPMLRVMQLPTRLLPLAMQFLPLMGGTLFLEAQNIAISAVLRAHGRTRDPMWVTGAQNVLNAIGNGLLLFGLFGFPKLGVMGVAISGVCSRMVAFGALWLLLKRRTQVRIRARAYFSFPVHELRRILRIGAPAAGGNICWWLAFIAVTAFIARMGSAALATQTYVMQVGMWVILFAMSLGFATEILIGHLVGAGDFEATYRAPFRSVRVGLFLVVGTTSVVALVAPRILGVFTQDDVIIATGTVLLRMGLVLETVRLLNWVFVCALRATGDARFPLGMGILSMLGLWVPLSGLLGLRAGLGLAGIWLAMIADESLR